MRGLYRNVAPPSHTYQCRQPARGSQIEQQTAAFRDAWKRRRCIVPATGIYEWKGADGRQPDFIHRRDGQPFGFAGLWEYWKGPEGGMHTCTIMTTDADTSMRPIHERMPVMVPADRIEGWLLFYTQESEASYDPGDMEMYPISTCVTTAHGMKEGPGYYIAAADAGS